ncbi:hypothetical protein WUBG_00203, partial [Wuchereria bancrofti]
VQSWFHPPTFSRREAKFNFHGYRPEQNRRNRNLCPSLKTSLHTSPSAAYRLILHALFDCKMYRTPRRYSDRTTYARQPFQKRY